jgi:hypothetical protein
MNHVIRTARRAAVAAAIILTSASAFATPINTVDNGGFEAPTQASTGFSYLGGTVNGWTYSGNSGVATNGSAFGLTNASGQAGILQQVSSISQSFITTGNILSLTFSAESRNYAQLGNSISVLIDGVALVFNGATVFTPTTFSSFTSYTSNVIALTAGTHNLSFVGFGNGRGGDVTTFIDNVSLTTAVPEPVTLGLFGLGLVALGATRRKARKQA